MIKIKRGSYDALNSGFIALDAGQPVLATHDVINMSQTGIHSISINGSENRFFNQMQDRFYALPSEPITGVLIADPVEFSHDYPYGVQSILPMSMGGTGTSALDNEAGLIAYGNKNSLETISIQQRGFLYSTGGGEAFLNGFLS